MSRNLTAWIFNNIKSCLEKGDSSKNNNSSNGVSRPARRMQVCSVHERIRCLILSDGNHSIYAFLTNSCVELLESKGGVRLSDLKHSLIQMSSYHLSLHRQSTYDRPIQELLKLKAPVGPFVIQISELSLLASDVQIDGGGGPLVNATKEVKQLLQSPTGQPMSYSELYSCLRRAQFPKLNVLPDFDGNQFDTAEYSASQPPREEDVLLPADQLKVLQQKHKDMFSQPPPMNPTNPTPGSQPPALQLPALTVSLTAAALPSSQSARSPSPRPSSTPAVPPRPTRTSTRLLRREQREDAEKAGNMGTLVEEAGAFTQDGDEELLQASNMYFNFPFTQEDADQTQDALEGQPLHSTGGFEMHFEEPQEERQERAQGGSQGSQVVDEFHSRRALVPLPPVLPTPIHHNTATGNSGSHGKAVNDKGDAAARAAAPVATNPAPAPPSPPKKRRGRPLLTAGSSGNSNSNDLVGRNVKGLGDQGRAVRGKVQRYVAPFYHVLYEDGQERRLFLFELKRELLPETQTEVSSQQETSEAQGQSQQSGQKRKGIDGDGTLGPGDGAAAKKKAMGRMGRAVNGAVSTSSTLDQGEQGLREQLDQLLLDVVPGSDKSLLMPSSPRHPPSRPPSRPPPRGVNLDTFLEEEEEADEDEGKSGAMDVMGFMGSGNEALRGVRINRGSLFSREQMKLQIRKLLQLKQSKRAVLVKTQAKVPPPAASPVAAPTPLSTEQVRRCWERFQQRDRQRRENSVRKGDL
eukprot:gene34269-41481_t